MDHPVDPFTVIEVMLRRSGLDGAGLQDQTADLAWALGNAIPSLLGFTISLGIDGTPVIVQVATRSDESSAAGSSLHLPLAWMPDHAGSSLTFYASTPGAFVDLAADLAFAIGPRHGIVLDGNLDALPRAPAVFGLAGLSVVNRAVGMLIERGLEPDTAMAELEHRSAHENLTVPEAAAELIARSGPDPSAPDGKPG